MKFLRQLFFFVLALLVAAAALSVFMPVKQTVEKTITIQAPASMVYEQLAKLDNFNKWSVWSQQDSTAKYTFTGTDGTVGAATAWKGDPAISGEGKIEITALEPGKKVAHSIQFSQPRKAKAASVFTLSENNGLTTLTWNFELATPRPWNIFNLFYSLDKELGKDFESGLATLKTVIEKANGTAPTQAYEVKTMDFPATSFAVVRQKIKWSDIPSFFSQHLPLVYEAGTKANASPGTATGLFYEWDVKNQLADMAAAVPVTPGMKSENNIVQVVNLPAAKAIYIDYYGAYDKTMDAYSSLDKYIADKKLTKKMPVIEQYITDPTKEKDTARWLTKIVFLTE